MFCREKEYGRKKRTRTESCTNVALCGLDRWSYILIRNDVLVEMDISR